MLHAPSRTAKIAGVAALAGLMMTVAIIAATDDPGPAPSSVATMGGGERHDHLKRELDRCATLTMPDRGCEAAWAENRRRFFRQDDTAPGTERDSVLPSSAESLAP